MSDGHSGETPETHVDVAVVTTSGSYPTSGTDRVAAHQPVRNELTKAAKELHIVDTTGWIARVSGTEIDVDKSYVDNHLTGTVKIDYGPREGGGGNE
jgi:hypothetical protein